MTVSFMQTTHVCLCTDVHDCGVHTPSKVTDPVSDLLSAAVDLDRLEGVIATDDLGEVWVVEDDLNVEGKVATTLWDHVAFWEGIGASDFALSVIKDGYKLNMKEIPEAYSEPNNESYRDNRDWVNSVVDNLVNVGIVSEVTKDDLVCISPLSVASHTRGKLRLCIDLSRCLNEFTESPRFRIESIKAALQFIEPNDFMFSFDLKSAYHWIPVNQEFWHFLGFKTEDSFGNPRFFQFQMLSFGLNNAARVLTKSVEDCCAFLGDSGDSVFYSSR